MSTDRRLPVLPAPSPPSSWNAGPPAVRAAVQKLPGGVRVVRLAGEIDHDGSEPVRRTLDRALQAPPPLLVLDLAGVAFCDVAGLNLLLHTREAARRANVRLVLAGPRPQLLRLLEAAGVEQAFAVRDTVAAALADRRGPG
ncbi:STAS domain-containing protein [Streptomyces sp. TLI_171]|uniref:STAS domain-containing protein n=1 Tax=Streptomyces sp. TLI_171 TaxID=1938859 RepID=UPI000C199DD2|nr:STAS domain-containing protein [Streptomyces sp. TLI_171]RKE17267.1 anti-sigma B factor antagonist [Streptomyces sp. TLI_171]